MSFGAPAPSDGVECVAHGGSRQRRALTAALARHHIPTTWTSTPAQTAESCQGAVARGCARLLVAGGDGSLQAAAGVLRGSQVALGIVPVGSGNDFARTLSIPPSVDAAVALDLTGPTRRIDLGLVRCVHQGHLTERVFVNIAQAGLGAAAARLAERYGKRLGPHAKYAVGILASLVRARPATVELTVDQQRLRIARLTNLVVANGRFFGGGLQPTPQAHLDDGEFDVVAMQDFGRLEIARRLRNLRHGPPTSDARWSTWRAQAVAVHGAERVPVEADGQLLGTLLLRCTSSHVARCT